MSLLSVEPLDTEVLQWLRQRWRVRCEPDLAADRALLRGRVRDARALLVPPSVAVDAALLAYAPRLRMVGSLSETLDHVDEAACARAGVEVLRPVSAGAVAEAEFTIGALLQLLRRVPVLDGGMPVGRELGGCRVGVIGLRASARPLAALLRGFGAAVVGYDPGVHATEPLWPQWQIMPVSLAGLMEQCDAVCVLLPHLLRYQGLIGERYFERSKPDQVMVALTPSSVFDESALAQALREGRLAAVWLDSAEPGSVARGGALYGVPHVQITPRVAGATRDARRRAAWALARRIDESLSELARQAQGAAPPAAADAPPQGLSPGASPGLSDGPARR